MIDMKAIDETIDDLDLLKDVPDHNFDYEGKNLGTVREQMVELADEVERLQSELARVTNLAEVRLLEFQECDRCSCADDHKHYVREGE